MSSALVVTEAPKEQSLSWGEVDWMIEIAVAKMKEHDFHPLRIIPVGGGGIIPAGIMAYRMYKKDGIPVELLPPVYARSYNADNKQQELMVYWPNYTQMYDDPRTLFVDDIVDSGKTWQTISGRMPKAGFFALVTKIHGLRWFSTFDDRNHWWNFPWEKVPSEVRT